MSLVRFLISAVFLAAGLSVILIAIIGVYRFHYIMNRMHSAAIIDAVGLFLILTGLMILSGNAAYIPKLLLVLMIQWIGSPIACWRSARATTLAHTCRWKTMNIRRRWKLLSSRRSRKMVQDQRRWKIAQHQRRRKMAQGLLLLQMPFRHRRCPPKRRKIMDYIELFLLLLIVVCGIATCVSKNLMVSLIIFMAYSVLMSIVWAFLKAPDLAVTEAAVGAGISSILLFITLKRLRDLRDEYQKENGEEVPQDEEEL